MKTTSKFLDHDLIADKQFNIVLSCIENRTQHIAKCEIDGLTINEAAEHTQRIADCVNAFKGIPIAPQEFVQDALAAAKQIETLLDLLYKSKEALDLAIQSTPSGVVRNTLAKKSIEISNILNPELVEIPKI